jgi:hypothetical protein
MEELLTRPTRVLKKRGMQRERNNRHSKDLERSLKDILSSFFHLLFLLTAAFLAPLAISYDDFLVHFSLSS